MTSDPSTSPTTKQPTSQTVLSGGELWAKREFLGMGRRDLARVLRVGETDLRRWEKGKRLTGEKGRRPDWESIAAGMAGIERATEFALHNLVTELQEMLAPRVVVYSEPDQVPAGRTDVARYGLGWWRVLAARAARQVPGTRITLPPENK